MGFLAADLIKAIAREENSVDVTHIGEPEFVVTYETQKHNHLWYSWIKTGFVCVLTFLGGAFSIMTFNMDVDTSGLFFQLYRQFYWRDFHRAYHIGIHLFFGSGTGRYLLFQSFWTQKTYHRSNTHGSADARI